MDHLTSAPENIAQTVFPMVPLNPGQVPFVCQCFIITWLTFLSREKKKKRFLSFKEKRKECPFCVRCSKWRRGFQAFLQLIIMGFLTCISEITFGHASYTVPWACVLGLLFCSVVLCFTKYFFSLCANLIIMLIYWMPQHDRSMLCLDSSKTVKVSI